MPFLRVCVFEEKKTLMCSFDGVQLVGEVFMSYAVCGM